MRTVYVYEVTRLILLFYSRCGIRSESRHLVSCFFDVLLGLLRAPSRAETLVSISKVAPTL